jgi:UDP-N-acetylmuramate: L-alanyl-gamma-D-glutamyl-meso-diaminopimelate ligase
VKAVWEQFAGHRLVACLELHTFSSLNRSFLSQYAHTLDGADRAAVFYNPETIRHKRLEMISGEEVQQAFGSKNLQVFTAREELESWIRENTGEKTVLLLMSSGTFSGMDFKELSDSILRRII